MIRRRYKNEWTYPETKMVKIVTELQTQREPLEKLSQLNIVPIDILTSKTKENFTVKINYNTKTN